MAQNTPTTSDITPRTKVLANGAIYDYDRGRIVANPGGGNKAFTSDTAGLAVARRIDKKRDTIAAAAQAAVQSSTLVKAHGSDAWIAEIAQAQMQIATTPDAGIAATKAADWLITNAGIGEKQQDKGDNGGNSGTAPEIILALAAFADSIAGLLAPSLGITSIISNDDGLIVDALPGTGEGEGEEGRGGKAD